MRNKRIIFPIIFLIIILSSVGFYFLKKSTATIANASKEEIYTIASTDKVFVNGVITPEKNESIYIDATKGNVDKVSVKDGQTVKQGDTLFTYKNDQVTSQIEQDNEQITTYKKQKTRLADKKSDLKKQKTNNAANVALNSTIDSQISSYEDQIATLEDQISSMDDQINSLKTKETTTITAPIDGKLTLNENAKATGAPYITIESSFFYLKGNINEKEQPKLKVGQITDILILPTSKNVKGKITAIGNEPQANAVSNASALAVPTASAGTGSSSISYYEIDIAFDSQDNLTNGFHVQATVNLSDSTIKIPKKAVIEEKGKKYVFKVVDKKKKKQEITCEDTGNSQVIVSSGLEENDSIISNPTADTKEGNVVE